MGCKQSAPLKEETVIAPVATVQKVATPVAASPIKVKEASPVRQEEPVVQQAAEEDAPVAATEAAVPAEVVVADSVVEAPADAEQPVAPVEPVKVEEATTTVAAVEAAPVAAEKPKKSSKKKSSAAKKEKKAVVVAAAPSNDENAVPIAAKKVNTTEKRVAFAPRANVNVVAAPKQQVAAAGKKSGKGSKKHQNVEDAKVKEMTMAFQRLLTHADHLEYHLSNKNTYNKA